MNKLAGSESSGPYACGLQVASFRSEVFLCIVVYSWDLTIVSLKVFISKFVLLFNV